MTTLQTRDIAEFAKWVVTVKQLPVTVNLFASGMWRVVDTDEMVFADAAPIKVTQVNSGRLEAIVDGERVWLVPGHQYDFNMIVEIGK